ncbi:MAG: bifunctional UDP-N-acetylglucosamine diphosphorylase/glucosamine-1-phosphate N-acetyltransferase GlmU [Deltaproteobacteria bacterium]|nr:bifunctional UDP-N-acetylglucosamine diphosphorylase/glucosamine-1-phosphate N-acetyltransferase GlmU [Deltaproteobacteria bacterium]
MNDTSVIILAAGKGTRMGEDYPKVLARSDEGELLRILLTEVLKTNFAEIVLVIGFQAERVKEFVESRFHDPRIKFVLQNEQLGTGHALKLGFDSLSPVEHVLVLLGDVPLVSTDSMHRLVNYYKAKNLSACFYSMLVYEQNEYGRVIRDTYSGNVLSIEEYKHCSSAQKLIREVSTGVFVFEYSALSEVYKETYEYIMSACQSRGIEFYLPLLLEVFASKGMLFDALLSEDSDEFVGVNKKDELFHLNRVLAKRRIRRLREKGVVIPFPETVFVSPSSNISPGSLIGPNTLFLGENVVDRAKVLGFSVIENTELRENSVVMHFSHLCGAFVGKNSRVGPFARLREGTKIDEEASIGNFVELKNARISRGVKANHLAYLGDCSIGERTNVGAGVIFCNYDGVKKNFTEVGNECFIGSNVNLIAPIKVGNRVIIGAGTTVDKDVPDESLVVGRPDLKFVLNSYAKYFASKKSEC